MAVRFPLLYVLLVQITAFVVLVGGVSSKFVDVVTIGESECELDEKSDGDKIDSGPWLVADKTFERFHAGFSHAICFRDAPVPLREHSLNYLRGPPVC